MAHSNSTTNEPASTIATGPYHEDFSRLPENIKENNSAQFASHVRTIANGCGVIASITRQHMLDMDNGSRTLLSTNHMDLLAGLLEPLMSMLDDAASNQIDALGNAAREAAKKGGAK